MSIYPITTALNFWLHTGSFQANSGLICGSDLAGWWLVSLNVWSLSLNMTFLKIHSWVMVFPLLSNHSLSNDFLSFCIHIKGYLHVFYHACECVWSQPEPWQVDGVLRGPSHSLWSSPATSRGIHRVTSPIPQFTHHHLALWQRLLPVVAPLSNPVAIPLDTFPHISAQSAKTTAAECLISIYSCGVSAPPPPRSWITFKIYCIPKTQSRLPVYRSCQEAAMLVCSAWHTHCLMNSWAWRWKISVNVCVCVYTCLPFILHLH